MLTLRKVLLFSVCASRVFAAQPPLNLDQAKAIEMALGKNFSIEVQRFDPKIARERERGAWGRFDPEINSTYSQGEIQTRSEFRRDPATNENFRSPLRSLVQTTNWSAGVSGVTVWGLGYDLSAATRKASGIYESEIAFNLRQPLLRGFGTDANLAAVRIAKNNVTSSEWAVKDRVMQVITDVISVYNDLHFAQENLEVAKQSQELARQLLRDNIKRVEIGVMRPLDVTQAQAQVASREDAVITAGRVVKDQENFLKQLVTADIISLLGRSIKIAPPTPPPFKDNVLQGVAYALDLRPDYRQAKIDISSRRINLAFEKNQALPQLDLTASLSVNGFDDTFLGSFKRIGDRDQTSFTGGAVFNYPIGNNEAAARVNAEKLGVARALVGLKQLEQTIVVEVDNARGAVVTSRERIESTTEAARLARESLDAAEKRLIAGTGTVFEVLELQEELATALTAALRAKADYNKAVARYHLFTGTTLGVHRVAIE